MEEVATCFCGNQSWLIYDDRLECTKCKNEYHFLLGEIVENVNNKRREFLKIIFPPPTSLTKEKNKEASDEKK